MDETVNQLLYASKEVSAPARSARSTNTKGVAFLSVGMCAAPLQVTYPSVQEGGPPRDGRMRLRGGRVGSNNMLWSDAVG